MNFCTLGTNVFCQVSLGQIVPELYARPHHSLSQTLSEKTSMKISPINFHSFYNTINFTQKKKKLFGTHPAKTFSRTITYFFHVSISILEIENVICYLQNCHLPRVRKKENIFSIKENVESFPTQI